MGFEKGFTLVKSFFMHKAFRLILGNQLRILSSKK